MCTLWATDWHKHQLIRTDSALTLQLMDSAEVGEIGSKYGRISIFKQPGDFPYCSG